MQARETGLQHCSSNHVPAGVEWDVTQVHDTCFDHPHLPPACTAGQVVQVTSADFSGALAALQPSLSAAELARYAAIRDHYESQQGRQR